MTERTPAEGPELWISERELTLSRAGFENIRASGVRTGVHKIPLYRHPAPAALPTTNETPDMRTKNLAALVRRLARRLPADDPLRVGALDFLVCEGLKGSILRAAHPAPVSAPYYDEDGCVDYSRSPGSGPVPLPPDVKAAVEKAAETHENVGFTESGSPVFINYGDADEQYAAMTEMACPWCGGSGHKDDAPPRPVAQVDPMQDPMRPSFYCAADETPAESVLRKLACWLGVGGYNAPTVDAEMFHRKIVDGILQLTARPAPAEPPMDASELLKEAADMIEKYAAIPSGDPSKAWASLGLFAHLRRRVAIDRDAILEEAAKEIYPKNDPDDWTEYARHAACLADLIRAMKSKP